MAAELERSPLDVQLTPMRRRHLRTVLRIETEVYPRPWTMNLFVSELAMRSSRSYYVAKVGPTVVGYSGSCWSAKTRTSPPSPSTRAGSQHQIGTRLLLNIARDARAARRAAPHTRSTRIERSRRRSCIATSASGPPASARATTSRRTRTRS